MNFLKKNGYGIIVCLLISIPAWFIGKKFPVIGGAVISIITGMIISLFWNDKEKAADGIKFTSKVILQTAVVLLGFGMNLGVVFETGKESLPIIICTISTSLIVAYIMKKVLIKLFFGIKESYKLHNLLLKLNILGLISTSFPIFL